MTREIASSPVLTGLGLQVRSQRGRFYLERPLGEGDAAGVEAWGRITPLADSPDLLLEQERRKGSWSEIAGDRPGNSSRPLPATPRGRSTGSASSTRRSARRARAWSDSRSNGEGSEFVYAEIGRGVLGSGGPVPSLRAAAARPRRALGMVFVSPEAEDRRGERGPDTGAGAVRGDEHVGGELRRDVPLCPAGTGAGGPTGSGPARAGTSPAAEAWLVKRKWRQWGS